MLTLPPAVRVFVATNPTSMHCSFDGLAMLVRDVLQQNPLCGHLFLFFNKRKDQARILFWDRHGFCVVAKRLERGTYQCAHVRPDCTHVEIEAAELAMILEGIDLRHAKRRTRWQANRAENHISAVAESMGMTI